MVSDIPRSLVTVREASAILNIAESTLRGWLCDRRLRFYKVGRRTMLKRQDLDAYIEAQAVNPEAPIPSVLGRRRRRSVPGTVP